MENYFDVHDERQNINVKSWQLQKKTQFYHIN
jgi:hypothetical protein